MYFCLQTNNKVNIFALEIWDDEAAKCTFYTVKYDDVDTNETDLFFEKYDAIAEYKEANQELLSFVLLYKSRKAPASDSDAGICALSTHPPFTYK